MREEGGLKYFLWGSISVCVQKEIGSGIEDELRVFPGWFSVLFALWCVGLYGSGNVRNGGQGR